MIREKKDIYRKPKILSMHLQTDRHVMMYTHDNEAPVTAVADVGLSNNDTEMAGMHLFGLCETQRHVFVYHIQIRYFYAYTNTHLCTLLLSGPAGCEALRMTQTLSVQSRDVASSDLLRKTYFWDSWEVLHTPDSFLFLRWGITWPQRS